MAKVVSSGGFANMSKNDKIKLISASAVLVIALIWIGIWAMSGGEKKVQHTEAEIQQATQEHTEELKKVEKEQRDVLTKKGTRPMPPPAGS